ncbi:type VI secretion system baseplate subunit TssK [Sorangium sp. So ce295]|uniref:type VI secretion system baseplate subunit TssK n=1 Tax=Sorangium sp. So ce295 TaxID=3133295 RepID=UPI003F60B320
MASLTRIAWRIGQVLRPEDFEALEEALAEEARARGEIPGLPSYGWLALAWDAGELSRGALRIDEAQAALPSGNIVRGGDNVALPEPLSLKQAGRTAVDVHFQVLSPDPPLAEPRPQGSVSERLVLRSQLAFEPAAPRGRSLLVGRFETRDGKSFHASPDVVPPLLRLRATPHLYEPLLLLRDRLVRYDDDLAKHVAAARRSAGPVQALLRGRAEVRKARALLDDVLLKQESPAFARLHPHPILHALRELLLEVHLLSGELPADPLPLYDHDNLGEVFGGVMGALLEQIDNLPPAAPTLPFREEEGRFVTPELPDHVLDAAELYLIIERPAPSGEGPIQKYNIRVGEPGRLPWLSQYSTLGIRPVLSSSPPADFGPRADVYALPKPGRTAEEKEEWAHVRKARAMGFVRTKEMAGIRAALYWTNAAPQAGRGGAGAGEGHEAASAGSATRPDRR